MALEAPLGPVVAVVIQTMVEADIAGVIFTRDPAPVPLNA
jgi:phosphoenolpyruvate synthase/pyruvate phosphate dikinase